MTGKQAEKERVAIAFGHGDGIQLTGTAPTGKVKRANVRKNGAFNPIALRVVGRQLTLTANGEKLADNDSLDFPDDGVVGWTVGPNAQDVIRDVQFQEPTRPAEPDQK
ncbi:MAG: hypothetical protein K2P78_02150 [Gemmataceae bacterium]|nr:hypothetical protein [Gemmataceae bacterium]